MTLSQQKRLKLCIIGQLLLLLSAMVPTILLANKESPYYRFGPNEDLIIISIKINTWTRYIVLIGYIMVFSICKVCINEFGMPILNFNIYDPNRKKVQGFTKTELQLQANTMYMLNSIRHVLTLQLSILQIDIAVMTSVFSELAAVWTVDVLLQEKTFEGKGDLKECLVNGPNI